MYMYILSVICTHLHWLKCKLLAYYYITGKFGGFSLIEATLTSAERLILSVNLDDLLWWIIDDFPILQNFSYKTFLLHDNYTVYVAIMQLKQVALII